MKLKSIYWILGICLIIISIGGVLFGSAQSTQKQNDLSQIGVLHHIAIQGMPETQVQPITKVLESAPISRFRKLSDNLPEPTLTAQSAIVVDFATGDMLFQKNPLDRHQPASITKLLTAIVAEDEYKWDSNTYLTMSQTAFDIYGGNSLQVGEKFTTEDIIRAALMLSSNDSAELLAESFGGVDNFVAKMNKKAQDLKMDQSKFFNAHGLDEEPVSNYTSTADLIKLTQYIYDKHPELIAVLAQKETVIKSESGQSIRLGNTNELLEVMPEMLAAKTGLTDEAGETLASVVSIQNRILGIVVLQSGMGGYRFQDTKSLIKWVQDNYSI